jgi:hypothetical protein
VFPEHPEELAMEAAEVSLVGQGRAFVSRFSPSWRSAHQEKPVSLSVDGLFDLSTKDDQLLS